jgi:phosphoserine phosphatase
MTRQPSHRVQLGLAAFDLDGTLMAVRSPYSYVHEALGVQAKAAEIKARYLQGELTYQEWGQEEVGLWRGLPVDRLLQIVSAIPYWPGAVDMIRRLKAAGVTVALVSAGFDLHVRRRAVELEVDFAYCNRLGVANGRLTGEYFVEVNGRNKGSLLQDLQVRYGACRSQTLAAGDTLHDTQMFPNAAISVAVAPTEDGVAEEADLLLPDGDWSKIWQMIEACRPGWLPR